MRSELQEVQTAGGVVLAGITEAFERGELSDVVALGINLVTMAHMMKPEHQPGALSICRHYAEATGINFEVMDEQVQARIYQQVQLARMEAGLGEDGESNAE